MSGIVVEKEGTEYNYVLTKVDPNTTTNTVKNNFIDRGQFVYVTQFDILVGGEKVNYFQGIYVIKKTEPIMNADGINARLLYIKLAEELGYDESIVPAVVD